MSIHCRISECQWRGTEKEIFYHFESSHRQLIREPAGKTFYNIELKDLQQETLVLVGQDCLYWWSQDPYSGTTTGIAFGIFHIGSSKCQEYTLKVDLRPEMNLPEFWGPYKTQEDLPAHERHSDAYGLLFGYHLLEVLSERMKSAKLRLYFGELHESNDDVGCTALEMDRSFHQPLCFDKLTCCVCWEFIRRDARFCENEHFVCQDCFDAMWKCRKLRCPTCRGLYLYDCSSKKLECWLGQIKWADNEDDQDDGNK